MERRDKDGKTDCKVKSCPKATKARGYCSAHYQAFMRAERSRSRLLVPIMPRAKIPPSSEPKAGDSKLAPKAGLPKPPELTLDWSACLTQMKNAARAVASTATLEMAGDLGYLIPSREFSALAVALLRLHQAELELDARTKFFDSLVQSKEGVL